MNAEELELRILSELDEAGEEHVSAMLNTVVEPSGDPAEVALYQDALRSLISADLARMATTRDQQRRLVPTSADESLSLVQPLNSQLVFSSERRIWVWTGAKVPDIVITDEGAVRAREILASRGYQWWRITK